MEHHVIDLPCCAGLSPLADISHILATMGKSPVHIAVMDIGYSGSGLCDRCEPFRVMMDDYPYPPASENQDDR